MPDPAMVDLLNPVPSQQARLLLANGDPTEALRLTRQRGLGADDQPDYPHERVYLLLARVLLAEQAPDRAVVLLGRLQDLAAAQGRVGGVVEVLALRALALEAVGDDHGGLAALAEALRLAAPEGHLRVFLDDGAPMASLLGKLATTPAEAQAVAASLLVRGHLDRLVQAFHRQGLAVLARPRPGGVVAPGTGRAAHCPRAAAALAAGRRPVQSGDRRGAGDQPGHRQAPRQPCAGQAGGGQPDPGRQPRPGPEVAPHGPGAWWRSQATLRCSPGDRCWSWSSAGQGAVVVDDTG
jgi:MalT-like TPR region